MAALKMRDIEQRFALLEDRVFKIELRLGPEVASPKAETAPPLAQQVQPAASPFLAAAAEVAIEKDDTLAASLLRSRQSHAVPPPLPASVSLPAVQPVIRFVQPELPPQAISYATPTPTAPPVQGAFERAIGLKWSGWVGAIVLMIGAAFGVKFIYDQHWFAKVPPALWLTAIFAGGLGLIAVGEAIYRRVHIIPAASVFGAGVATLFLAGYVGNAYYNLYSPGAALFLMAAAALVGALVAMRGNLVSIAVLSNLGANVAPLLVGSRSAPLESFLIYLLALQMVSLSLASWGRGKKWWTLRSLSLVTTSLWIAATGLRPGEESLVAIFAIVYAALYHGELIQAAMRRHEDASSPSSSTAAATVAGPDAIAFSLLVTAALTAVLLWASRLHAPEARSAILLAMAAAFAGLGWALPRFTAGPTSAIRKISIAHRIAAAALVALAVPVACSGLHADIGWGILALAFAVTGAITQSKIARLSSVVIWLLGVVHLAMGTFLPPELGGHHAVVWFTLFGTGITRDAVFAFGLSAIGQIVAAISFPASSGTRRAGLELSGIATAVWVVASVLSLPPLAATAWIVEFAWLLVAFEVLAPQLQFSLQAAVLILLATVKWAIVDTLADRLAPGWSPAVYRPVFNPMMGIGALLCASIITLWSIRGRAIWRALRKAGDVPAGSSIVLVGVVVAILTLGLSFEIDRVVENAVLLGNTLNWPVAQEKLLAWTVLWSISTMVLMSMIAIIEPAGQQRANWFKRIAILPVLLAAKFILLDSVPMWSGSSSAYVLLNLQVLAAVLVAGCLLAGSWLASRNVEGDLTLGQLRSGAILLATAVLMWSATLEIDRLVEQMAAGGTLHWPLWQAKQLAWTIGWTIAAASAFAILRWRDPTAMPNHEWPRLLPKFITLMAIKYLTIDTVAWRLLRAPANVTVLANLESAAGLIVFAALVMLLLLGLPAALHEQEQKMRRMGFFFASLILLWTGSIEIDRYFAAVPVFNGGVRPEQLALSIFWAIFAIACVVVGFRVRAAALRFFGLGLLAVTLLKVVLIDMSQVQAGYRILSFMGLGAVMMATSVLYGKFGPRLLRDDDEEESPVSVG